MYIHVQFDQSIAHCMYLQKGSFLYSVCETLILWISFCACVYRFLVVVFVERRKVKKKGTYLYLLFKLKAGVVFTWNT